MGNLIAKSFSIAQQSNFYNIKNVAFEAIYSSLSNIKVAENKALKNKESKIFSLPP